jgi:Kef-type K+ transport system membrane component KefB
MEMLLEIGIIVIITALICSILAVLRQPIIIGYIISGIIVGPYFLNYITFSETFNLFSHLGIALLLFIVGLNLNPKVIKEVGKVSLITGLGQVVFTSLIGFIICRLFGLSTTVSLYVSVAITFSSTIIIMKLLSDKNDIGTLYGKISIGFLIVQDIIVIIILMLISSINQGLDNAIIDVAMKGLVLVVIIALAAIFILPAFLKLIARSQELMLLFSISWCLALATLFYYLGFSVEIGALLAGITLSLSPYRFEISSRMKPLRDFFLVIFFILLGSQMTFANIYSQIPLIITLSLFILIGNPLIVMVLMGLLGYSKRNSFLAGLTVAQISEFSLILISLGVSVGHLGYEIQSIITVIGLITIGNST